MSYDPQEKPTEKKSIFGVIVHSFFVVPFLLAVFSVLLFAAVRILTMEKRSAYDYLQDVKTGGLTKRWQSAFDLSRIISSKSKEAQDLKFINGLKEAFESSSHDDDRVRQYLIMAMAKTGNPIFVDVLLKSLPDEKDENLYAIISALGILKDVRAGDALLKYVDDDNPRIRLVSVISLGNIYSNLPSNAKVVNVLKAKLNDLEPNVVWDAAIALAKMNDQAGKAIIIKLMDRNYLNQFKNIDPQAQSRIVAVAVEATSVWNDPEINVVLKKLFESDVNMNVRSIAKKILDKNVRTN